MNFKSRALYLAGAFAVLSLSGVANATTYTFDSSLGDFVSASTEIAQFTTYGSPVYGPGDYSGAPVTPTVTDIQAGRRVIGDGSSSPIIATFSHAVSSIRVFNNEDHPGPGGGFDGYQYTISGCNGSGVCTLLYDPISVTGSDEPFFLNTYTGIAPTRVNVVATLGQGPAGFVDYIADFNFGTAYTSFVFGSSTLAINSGNGDQELTAVAAIPEPSTWAMMILGFFGVGFMAYRRKSTTSGLRFA